MQLPRDTRTSKHPSVGQPSSTHLRKLASSLAASTMCILFSNRIIVVSPYPVNCFVTLVCRFTYLRSWLQNQIATRLLAISHGNGDKSAGTPYAITLLQSAKTRNPIHPCEETGTPHLCLAFHPTIERMGSPHPEICSELDVFAVKLPTLVGPHI